VSKNSARINGVCGRGGGIYNDYSGWLTVLDSSITGNHASDGADLYNLGQFTKDKSSRISKIGP